MEFSTYLDLLCVRLLGGDVVTSSLLCTSCISGKWPSARSHLVARALNRLDCIDPYPLPAHVVPCIPADDPPHCCAAAGHMYPLVDLTATLHVAAGWLKTLIRARWAFFCGLGGVRLPLSLRRARVQPPRAASASGLPHARGHVSRCSS